MLSKTHTIEAILDLNPSANPAFLAEFPPTELTQYLFRLVDISRTQNQAFDQESASDGETIQRRMHA